MDSVLLSRFWALVRSSWRWPCAALAPGGQAGGQGCAAVEMRIFREMEQLGEPERLPFHPAHSPPGCWGLLGWEGDPGLPLGWAQGDFVARGCPWDPWDHHPLQQRLGSLCLISLKSFHTLLGASSPGNSFPGLEGHRNPRKNGPKAPEPPRLHQGGHFPTFGRRPEPREIFWQLSMAL